MNDELVLALDPGSICSGWAVMDRGEQLIEAGVLTPDKAGLASKIRIARMCEDLLQLLAEWEPGIVVIEWASGKVIRSRHKGHGAGLAIHGAATGALWQAAEAWRRSLPAERQSETQIILIAENLWTNGVPKRDRLAGIAAVFNQYKPENDKTGDIGDAIGLALWHIQERRVQLARYSMQKLTSSD